REGAKAMKGPTLIVWERLAIGALVLALLAFFLGPCRQDADGAPVASRTAYEVMLISLLVEWMNERGFDFESIGNIRQLREAAVARSEFGKKEFDGDYLLKTPYKNEYQYRFLKTESGCFVEVFAEVPDYVPERWKKKMKKRVAVSQHPKEHK